MLEIKNLSKNFNNSEAVKNVSFKVGPGEIYSLIGPNGSGKTTIIKLTAGLLKPSGGNILVGGKDAVRHPKETKALIGYIPDDPSIWSAMTGLEFLHFSGALFGVEEKKRSERIPELLSIFSLAGVERGFFEDYSRGNKQKFTILAALLHRPRLLLIDEPIVGLDPVSAEIAEKLFYNFAGEGGSILLVTHTLPVAERIAGRLGILKGGTLSAEGTKADLCKKAGLDEKKNLTDIYKALTL